MGNKSRKQKTWKRKTLKPRGIVKTRFSLADHIAESILMIIINYSRKQCKSQIGLRALQTAHLNNGTIFEGVDVDQVRITI